MKKLSILFIILLFIPFTLAISTDMKPVYQPSETLIIEIFGNILSPIMPEDVELKRINVQVPWEYDVKRVGERYFLWGTLPNVQNNYTLIIKDIRTTVSGVPQNIDFSQDFSTFGEIVSYSIKPGFIITQEDEFEITVFSYGDFPEPINVNFPQEHEVILSPGENKLTFSTLSVEPGFIIIQIGIYLTPVLILGEEQDNIQDNEIILPEFRFFPKTIESVILFDENPFYPFSIINTGGESIEDLILEYDSEIFIIEPSLQEVIAAGETLNYTLTLKKQNEPIEEIILLRSGNLLIEFPITVAYTENLEQVQTPYLDENYSETQGYYCEELGGKACTAGEVCSTDTLSSLDISSCCLGTCSDATEETSYAWVGYLIAAVLLVVVVIILGRYIKTRKQHHPLEKTLADVEKKKKKRRFDYKPNFSGNRPAGSGME